MAGSPHTPSPVSVLGIPESILCEGDPYPHLQDAPLPTRGAGSQPAQRCTPSLTRARGRVLPSCSPASRCHLPCPQDSQFRQSLWLTRVQALRDPPSLKSAHILQGGPFPSAPQGSSVSGQGMPVPRGQSSNAPGVEASPACQEESRTQWLSNPATLTPRSSPASHLFWLLVSRWQSEWAAAEGSKSVRLRNSLPSPAVLSSRAAPGGCIWASFTPGVPQGSPRTAGFRSIPMESFNVSSRDP